MYNDYCGVLLVVEKEIRIMVLVMSFMKMLNLARVYDTLSCFLKMLELCLID